MIIYHRNLNIHLSLNRLQLLMFVYGIFNSGIVASYAFASEIVRRPLAGISLGITNMVTVLIGSFFIPIIGLIIHILNRTHYNLLDSCSLHGFKIAFLFLPASLTLCLIITLFLKDSYARRLN
jgi:hypothetical protein